MACHAPGNTATIPVAIHKEKDKWTAIIQIREPGVADFSIEATKPQLIDALNTVFRHISRFDFYAKQSREYDYQMGITDAYALPTG